MPQQLTKTYVYKVYDGTTYLGDLQDVISTFSYSQQLYTIGAELKIKVAVDTDVAPLPIEDILDENGQPLLNEENQKLTIERQPDRVGDTNQNNLIRNDNSVVVWEYDSYYPNGRQVFSGYISKWKTSYGTNDESVEITCLSNGQDLNHYLILGGTTPYITNSADNGTTYTPTSGSDKYPSSVGYGQNFTMTANKTISGISVYISNNYSGNVSIYLRQGTGVSGTGYGSLASGSAYYAGSSTKTEVKVVFNTPVSLTNGTTYFFVISAPSGIKIHGSNANPYANGNAVQINYEATYTSGTMLTNDDLQFIVYEKGNQTYGTYNSQDPSTMLTDFMSSYISSGGLVKTPNANITNLVTQTSQTSSYTGAYWGAAIAQEFTPSKDMTINTFQFYGGKDYGAIMYGITWKLYKGNPSLDTADVISGTYIYTVHPSNQFIATSSTSDMSDTTYRWLSVYFSNPINLTKNTKYYMLATFNQGEFGYRTFRTTDSVSKITDTQVGKLYTSSAVINNAACYPSYNSSQPALSFIVGYISDVSLIGTGGYKPTGITATYQFKLNTVLEGIQSVVKLSPSNWFWYVDPSDNTLYFQSAATSKQLTFEKGKHISSLAIEATKEYIVNNVWFTGGDDGTGTSTDIVVNKTDATSIATDKIGLSRISDNRVKSTTGGVTTANLIAQNEIDIHKGENYQTEITILADTMDLSKIKLGMIVDIKGFGNFIDNFLLQIVGIKYEPDQVTLTLGVNPKRATKTVEEINSRLTDAETKNASGTPS